jgi:hypothetical protein
MTAGQCIPTVTSAKNNNGITNLRKSQKVGLVFGDEYALHSEFHPTETVDIQGHVGAYRARHQLNRRVIGALLDSVSNEHHRTLRAKAQQNIISVTEAVSDYANLAPHLQEIVGALWLRSIAVGNLAGADWHNWPPN